jgi:DNA-binding transcriptional LysR family regulator
MDHFFSSTVGHFLAVAREGKISSAAKKIGLTQSALSMSIKKFEDNIGFMLFQREKRGLTLTSQGAQLFEVLQQSRGRFFDEVHDVLSFKKKAAIKIGCIAHEGPSALLPCLDKLKSDMPPYHLYLLRSMPIYKGVSDGTFHFGFVTWANRPEGHLISRRIRHNDMAVVGLKKNFPELPRAKSLKDLQHLPWIKMPKVQHQLTEDLPLYGNGFICDGTEQLKQLVLTGRGISHVQLKWFTAAERKQLAVSRVIPEDSEAAVYGICHKNLDAERKTLFEKICERLQD